MSFCRIQYLPPRGGSGRGVIYAPRGWFVLAAEGLYVSAEGKERFSDLRVTRFECNAAVYTEMTGQEILRVIRQFQPKASLTPATFAEWIESPAFSCL